MGKKSQEKMTGKTFEQRKANAGNPFSRAIRALKNANRGVLGKKHQYGIGNASRDGIPKKMDGMPSISLREKPETEQTTTP